jgi:hypothetical protein
MKQQSAVDVRAEQVFKGIHPVLASHEGPKWQNLPPRCKTGHEINGLLSIPAPKS